MDTYCIRIEALENAFTVEVPDLEMIAEKKAAATKAKQADPYVGDCTEKYAAADVKAVLKIVSENLKKLPEGDYDKAFGEAATKK